MNAQTAASALARSDSQDQGELVFLPLDRVEVKPGFNARTYFDLVALQELAESIKEQGVIQAITVRPHPDKDGYFVIIAGERRWRASRMAGLSVIPAMVLNVSEKDALIINGLENFQRENISPAEEAVQVRRMVQICDGDRDEAARHLGYTRRVVDARLLLLNATDNVRDALSARKIKLGHAELLATLPADKQDINLTRIIETGVSVDNFRAKFSAYALHLSAAIFDTTGCQGCDHNTSKQAGLFDVHIGDGRCTNHQCFEQKRQEKLRLLKVEHQSTYNNVQLDSEVDPNSFTLLVKSGPQGVGHEQMKICLGCKHYGALLSTKPGEEGRLDTDVCFNLTCHREKVAEYRASLASADNSASIAPANMAKGPDKATGSTKTAAKSKSSSSAAETPKRVEEIIHRFYRETAATAIRENPRLGLVFAAYALLNDVSTESREVMKKYGLSSRQFGSGNLHKGIEALAALDKDKLKELVVETAMVTVKDKMENGYGKDVPDIVKTAKVTLKNCNTDLSRNFLLDRAFLEVNTKSGIEALMNECQFDKWYNEKKQDDKAFRRLMSMKNDAIIKEILSCGFDFKGFVPKCVRLA